MPSVCGSVVSVTLEGRNFSVAADSDAQLDIGGWNNTVMLNGNGTARLQKLRAPWKATGLNVAIDNSRGDHEYLRGLKAKFDWFPVAIELTDGTVFQGTGQITTETIQSAMNGTAPIELSGPGEMDQQ